MSSPQRYRPDDADRALVLMRPVVEDVRAHYLVLREELSALQELDKLQEVTSDASVPEPLRNRLAELQGCLGELKELGATLIDPEIGAISLPGVLDDGRDVRLCWKLGEPQVRWWFPAGGSYGDRRPIPAAQPA